MNNIILLIFTLLSFYSIGQSSSQIEVPHIGRKDSIIQHFAYSVSYNHHFRQANWVAYQLTKSELIKVIDRNNNFTTDPLISETDNLLDYKKSGYDRGHLAPAADMVFSETSMKESFYFSNISPQNPSFNRGIWNKLEEKTREWTQKYDSIFIVVGPVLTDSLKTIGVHKIAVPKYYFKVLLDKHINHEKAIAFLIPNEASDLPIEYFSISVNDLEKKLGFDFFPLLNDELENKIESIKCYECWEHKNH